VPGLASGSQRSSGCSRPLAKGFATAAGNPGRMPNPRLQLTAAEGSAVSEFKVYFSRPPWQVSLVIRYHVGNVVSEVVQVSIR